MGAFSARGAVAQKRTVDIVRSRVSNVKPSPSDVLLIKNVDVERVTENHHAAGAYTGNDRWTTVDYQAIVYVWSRFDLADFKGVAQVAVANERNWKAEIGSAQGGSLSFVGFDPETDSWVYKGKIDFGTKEPAVDEFSVFAEIVLHEAKGKDGPGSQRKIVSKRFRSTQKLEHSFRF